ncbi:hypothetical protein AB0I81_22770 [Nonomuraea sp. NPDC050404]|uniref:hypothetical protein n=1 Tax=Nonomuraea sp. NPDC050404 TaxID=3155783 RepID=UPI00340F59EB
MTDDRPHPHPLKPEDLEPGDHWTRACPHCPAYVQGGRAGLGAHIGVVHPKEGPA